LSKLLQPPGKDFSGAKCVASKQLFKAADLRKDLRRQCGY